ncbi:transcription factor E2F6 [Scomber japonicus]|uniref:transcription factor E2F6 n=1 Tax=Scomber japonicus TaxID=13676 RepID=UPI0023054E6D|nr:transcription factor E2F6 [Scomber japonicus]
MVKCVVSGCPSRLQTAANRGILNRPAKRFFNFPKDPARVKVWLAALRETDKQDSTDQHLICEDHFLPEDVTQHGVNSDAIPIMPPYLDGPMGMGGSWGGESSEGEDQWATGGCDDEEEDEGGDDAPVYMEPPAPEPEPEPEPPAPEPPKQQPVRLLQNPSGSRTTTRSASMHPVQAKRFSRQDVSLGLLARRFLELLLASPDGMVDLRQAVSSLQTRKRRIYDITNVLTGISLIEKQSACMFKWIGKSPISCFLWNNPERLQKEMENLKLVEDTLDGLIKSCAQQLFDMTDNTANSPSAYVTYEDVRRLSAFQDQTLFVVKAPEETKLEVPPPTEDYIQVRLKGGKGPIKVLTCDMGSGSMGAAERRGCFLTLEESRIKTSLLHTESSNPQSTMQSS